MTKDKFSNMPNEELNERSVLKESIDKMNSDFRSEFRDFLIHQAEKGNADAQFRLAERYFSPFDEYFDVDNERAFCWYEKAALQNHPKAQRMLGICYIKGLGIEENFEKGMSWLMKAAENDDDKAMVNVALALLNEDSSSEEKNKAVEYLHKAELINREAVYCLAICHIKGSGVDKSIKKAFDYLKEVNEWQDPNGAYKLAEIYEQGKFVEKDLEKAFEWYKRAAELGVIWYNRHQDWDI